MLGGADFHEFLNIVLAGSRKVVGSSTVVGDIKTNFFLKSIDTEHTGHVQDHEERSHEGKDPSKNPEDRNNLNKEKVGISSSLAPGVEPSSVDVVVSGNSHLLGLGEKTNSDNSPDTVGKVNRNGIDGVVNLHLDEEVGESVVDPSGNNSNETRAPWSDDRASGGDSDKSSKSTVHGHGEVIRSFPGCSPVNEGVSEHGGDTGSSGGNSSGDSTEGGSGGRIRVVNGQGGTRVESVPTDPEDESSENLKGNTVSLESVRGLEGISILVVESSLTGSKDNGSDKSGSSSSQVDDTRSGKVDNTNITPGVGTEGGQPSIGTPDGVDNNGVDKSSEEDRVAKVGLHLATFGDGSGDNSGGGGGESKLEEPSDVVTTRSEIANEEVVVSNEGSVTRGSRVVGKGETNGPETKSTTTGIQQVLQHDILDVLGADRSSAEHGETRLHEENHGSLFIKRFGVK